MSAVSERIDQSGIADVDLLFMIDNSGSMANKQKRLGEQLPRLIGVLTSGDRFYGIPEADIPDGVTDKDRYFTKVKSLHLGVVSSNLGGVDEIPPKLLNSEGFVSCQGNGDEGKLKNSTAIAVEGVIAKSDEFPDYEMGDTVLEPDPECKLSQQPRYQEYPLDDGASPDDLALRFRCMSRLGVRGCPFEQQLESTWRAVAPSTGNGDRYKFLNGTKGQADGYNAGFLREEAVLAIMLVTDEDDCSIKDAGKVLFEESQRADEEFGNGSINVRCGYNETNEKYLWPVSRYVEAFRALKPDYPDRIIFGAITGIPLKADGKTYEQILALPDMQFREVLGAKQPIPEPSCTVPDSQPEERAYPPRRILRVAEGFGEEQSVIYSICEKDYGPALDKLILKIASKLKGNCLPRKLTRGQDGKVNCDVYELLPKGVKECERERGHLDDKAVERQVREDGKVQKRLACRMAQVPVVTNGSRQEPKPGAKGWYYDNFTSGLAEECENDPQRISFQFGEPFGSNLPSGAGAVFECFQPVARVETTDVKGFDAVNTTCVDDETVCSDQRSDADEDGYKLICVDDTTCQIKCKDNPDCPPGWVCAKRDGKADGDGPSYCQIPTCPQEESAGSSGSSSERDGG